MKHVFQKWFSRLESQEARLQNIINKLSYKPGTAFFLDKTKAGYAVLLELTTKDIKNEVVDVPLISTIRYTAAELRGMTDTQILMKIRRQVHEIEVHEADEWLKYDTKQIVNPHSSVL